MQNDINQMLNVVSEDFASNCAEIRHEIASWQKQIEALEKEDRDLTIAIVGRVKSGKSSLLNALFFDGRSVLPQAATPMTAALTFLKYDDHYHAEVEYFTKQEWEGFKELADSYHEKFDKKRQELVEREEKRRKEELSEFGRCERREITDEYVREQLKGETSDEEMAAVELVTASAKIGPQLLSKLGTTEQVEIGGMEGEEAEQALMGRLQEYVGAGGANTPIVCSSTIYFPKLKGCCIIDTPGTNDPVVSRGMRTMEKLKKADVAIVVSPASSFFDQQDLDFCSQKLPRNGVEKYIVVASKIDDVLRGFINDNIDSGMFDGCNTPGEVLSASVTFCLDGKRERFHKECVKRSSAGGDIEHEKWSNFGDASKTEVIGCSSMAYRLYMHWDNLSSEEQFHLNSIFNRIVPAADFPPGLTFDREDLLWLSMLGENDDVGIRPILKSVQDGKMDRLEKNKKIKIAASHKAIGLKLKEFRDFIAKQIHDLETKSLAELKSELVRQTKMIEEGRSRLEGVFEEAITDALSRFEGIVADVSTARDAYAKLSVETESREVQSVKHVSVEGTWKGAVNNFLARIDIGPMFGPEAIVVTNTYTTRYANVSQAIELIDAFAEKARRRLEDAVRKAVDLKTLRFRIADAACKYFDDLGTGGEDITAIKQHIQRTLSLVKLPDSELGAVDYTAQIAQDFGFDRVAEGQIGMLKSAQREAIRKIISDLERGVREKSEMIESSLRDAQTSFVENILKGVREEQEAIVAKLSTKEETLARWNKDIAVVDDVLKQLDQ